MRPRGPLPVVESLLMRVFAGVLVVMGALVTSQCSRSSEDMLQRHRNLGKAFYENPATHAEAIAEFKKALDLAPRSAEEKLNYALALLRGGQTAEAVAGLEEVQRLAPTLPHTWFNLGIYYKRAGEVQKATDQFERMVSLVPNEPIGHYQLGTLYRGAGRTADAQAQFVRASDLDPMLAAAHFQLYGLYRQNRNTEAAARQLEIFQLLHQQSQGVAIPEDVDWCAYAEIYDPPRAKAPAPAGSKLTYEDRVLEGSVDAATAGVAAIDASGLGQPDLLVWSRRGVALYRHGSQLATDSGLAGISGVVFVAPGDFDNDGLTDLCVLTEAGPLLYRNLKGRFAPVDANLPNRRYERAVWIDYDHDYDLDLLLLGDSPALLRNQGAAGFADRTADFPFVKGRPASAFRLRITPDSKAFDLAVFYQDRDPVLYRDRLGGRYNAGPFTGQPADTTQVAADFDNDGRLDRATVQSDGRVRLQLNRTNSGSRWIRVGLTGIKNLKLAQDAQVEIKAGALYRKQTYSGLPLLFDLGGYQQVDVVRITWPNGLIQNETNQPADTSQSYKEAQRLSGSCPMIWTWNGREYEFITDVLGVAPLGASDGEGTYFPVDHDEFVQIPAPALHAVGQHYEIHITEELSEVSYLDQVSLFALDHPAGREIFTNEKFKGPPYPAFRLYQVEQRIYPKAAHDDRGRDVLPLIVRRDGRYPDQFARTELGVAEPHALELDFSGAAPSGDAMLMLSGWVDWPDGSTFRAVAQTTKGGLVMPYLQMQDAAGKWVTMNPDMGMPSGKPKTIAVPLHFVSSSRKLRIVTDLCVYWDEIFLSEDTAPAEVRQTAVPLASADLHFRGFSETTIDPLRKQPDTFIYGQLAAGTFWNPTPGMYTRYGDTRELLENVDDQMVIMGSGDELRLRFDASRMPSPPSGWIRDYLLKVDGWAKDRDPNTAFSTTVEPLPFHGMSRYPYPGTERFPQDAAHQRYLKQYITRPALRLIRPLENGS
jgi:tetratricopeptide (TPR) repeat protein